MLFPGLDLRQNSMKCVLLLILAVFFFSFFWLMTKPQKEMADDDLQALEGFANLGVNEVLVDLPDYRCPRCYVPQEGLRNHVQNCLQGDQLTIQRFWETAEAWEADWTGKIPLQVLLDLGESNFF
jgi:hypothetical protein